MHCFSDNGNPFSIRVRYTVRQLYFNNVSPVPCDRISKALCGQHGMGANRRCHRVILTARPHKTMLELRPLDAARP